MQSLICSFMGRLGDRVTMGRDKESMAYGLNGVPDGTQGVIVGYRRLTQWYGRVHNYGRIPGKYEFNAGPIVKWDTGEIDYPSDHNLWVPDGLIEERRKDTAYKEAFETEVWVEDLPEVPLWEGDKVKLHRHSHSSLGTIESINWHYWGQKRDDGSWMPLLQCSYDSGGTSSFSLNEVELVRRGNVWCWFNDKSNLKFDSVEEECALHFALNLVVQVRNPLTQNYHWPKEHVLSGLQQGLIDVIRMNNLFGSKHAAGYKFIDRELGERVRAIATKGFTP